MTVTDDEAAFHRIICAYPFDLTPRLVFADWLDENAGAVPCDYRRADSSDFPCTGGRVYGPRKLGETAGGREIWGNGWSDCPACAGAGTASDGRRERAEFIRLQCENQHGKPGNGARVARARKLFADHHKAWWPNEIVLYGRPSWEQWNDGRCVGLARNGFVSEVRCPLAWWIGGECEPCASGRERGDNSPCPLCRGTGRTLGHGHEVVARHPVTKVVVTDRGPHQRPNGSWLWFDTAIPHPPAELPRELFWHLSLLNVFPTREAAEAALSRVLVDRARERAGLPPVHWEGRP